MRLKPLVTQCLLAGVLTLPLPVAAVGLGKLTVQSGLGQPLAAEVDLTSVAREDLTSLTAKVADPVAYRQNNLDYPAAASRIRVQLAARPNGTPYLKITSPQSISDPFLDLLIEMNWASGRLVRNYTFLLDPPGALAQAPVEPSLAVQGSAPSRSGAGAGSAGAGAGAAGATVAGGAGAVPGQGARAGAAFSGDSYPVQRGDSLNRIAARTKPEGVTLEQMLIALLRANPGAFEGGNMNRLKAGQVLKVPAPEEVAAIPAADAAREVRIQATDWAAYRDRVAAAAPVRDAAEAQQAVAGRITGAVEDRGAARQPGDDRLSLSRGDRAAAGAAGAAAARAEDLVAKDKALAEMNARVAELERTVGDLRKALDLKSQALADLQKQAEAARAGAAEPPKVAAAPIAPVAPAPAPTAQTPDAKPTAPVAAPPKAEAPKVEPKAEETPKATPPRAGDATTAKPAPKAEPGFLESLFGDTPGWMVGAGALAVLGGVWALLAARRRRENAKIEETINATDLKTSTVFGQTQGGVVNTGEPSISSEFSREGLGSIDTDEVDPIAEAEVYLAYGRDAQAEEILKEALKKDPQRQEVYLKLLEIHSQHNKPAAFETVATELYSVSGGEGEVWQQAVALGRQMDPSNKLYGGGGTGGAAAAASAAAVGGAATAMAFDLVAPPTAPAEPVAPKPDHAPAARAKGLEESLDFDLDRFMPGAKKDETPAAADFPPPMAAPAPAAAGLELGSPFGVGTPEPASKRSPAGEPSEVSAKAPFDFDLKLDEILGEPAPAPASAGPAPARPREPALATMEFTPTPAKVAAAAGPAMAGMVSTPLESLDLDKLDLAFDATRTEFGDQAPALDSKWHDAATKLDLAKAYQEMGDAEGAREILQEVLNEGDEQQKKDAQALLGKMIQ